MPTLETIFWVTSLGFTLSLGDPARCVRNFAVNFENANFGHFKKMGENVTSRLLRYYELIEIYTEYSN